MDKKPGPRPSVHRKVRDSSESQISSKALDEKQADPFAWWTIFSTGHWEKNLAQFWMGGIRVGFEGGP